MIPQLYFAEILVDTSPSSREIFNSNISVSSSALSFVKSNFVIHHPEETKAGCSSCR